MEKALFYFGYYGYLFVKCVWTYIELQMWKTILLSILVIETTGSWYKCYVLTEKEAIGVYFGGTIVNSLYGLWRLLFFNFRNSSVRYVGITVTGGVGLLSGILRNGAISMVCVASAFPIPKTSMKSHQLRYALIWYPLPNT